jgi:hypothetical protein
MADELISTPSYQAFRDRAEVRPPVRLEHLPDLGADIQILQIANPLEAHEYDIVADWLRGRDVVLRVYAEGWVHGYGFLDRFSGLRRFSLAGWTTDALERLPGHTVELWLEHPRSRAVKGAPKETLAPLARLRQLEDLHVEGPAEAVETAAKLTSLRALRFRSCKLATLAPFAALTRLHTLEIRLGSLAEMTDLPRIGRLRYLELWRIAGCQDLGPVGGLAHLQHLVLQALPRVRTLPSMAGMASLRRVTLDTMKGLTDLTPLRDAPALEEIVVVACPQLREEHFRPLVNHATLRRARVGTGSVKRNAAIQALLGLPAEMDEFEFRPEDGEAPAAANVRI